MGASIQVCGCEPWNTHLNLDKTGMGWERGLGIDWENPSSKDNLLKSQAFWTLHLTVLPLVAVADTFSVPTRPPLASL